MTAAEFIAAKPALFDAKISAYEKAGWTIVFKNGSDFATLKKGRNRCNVHFFSYHSQMIKSDFYSI